MTRHPRCAGNYVEQDLGTMAAVSARGLRLYWTDAMDLALVPVGDTMIAMAVIADGMGVNLRQGEPAQVVASTAVQLLAEGISRGEDPAEASRAAASAAGRTLAEQAVPSPSGLSAATDMSKFVSAVMSTKGITVCWLGNCRAYWLSAGAQPSADPGGTPNGVGRACQLTRDDNLIWELAASGLSWEEVTARQPEHANLNPEHVITRWLGADFPEPQPHVERFTPEGPGALLLCSDGLWNGWPPDLDLADAVMPAALSHPLGAAAYLVRRVLDADAYDNVTAAVIPFPPQRPH